MLNKIDISGDQYSDYSEVYLDNLSKVNLFIGQNNSGKSRLIRKLFAQENLSFLPSEIDFNEVNRITTAFYSDVTSQLNSNRISAFGNIFNTANQYRPIKYITTKFNADKDIFKPFLNVTNTDRGDSMTSSGDRDLAMKILSANYSKYFNILKQTIPLEFSLNFEKFYIPTLRGLKPPIYNDIKDYYLERTKKDYFSDEETWNSKIFTGLSIYCLLYTSPSPRDRG